MQDQQLLYQIAMTMVPGVGNILGKKLVIKSGSAEAVFREKKQLLQKIPRAGQAILDALSQKDVFIRAEKQFEFIQRYRISTLFFQDPDYPRRLKNCFDGPMLIYSKGNADLNAAKIIGIVGTRNATPYGKDFCASFLGCIKEYNPLIISGLAFGIDSCAHRLALENGLQTIGVLGHGLDRIYPQLNKSLAERMIMQGGLITEFPSETRPDRENFPMRNRIIAGLCDAIVVVEAAKKGGALITADIANTYNRDVFAVPGRIGDLYSEGTNFLIKTNKAALIQSAEDLIYLMNWDMKERRQQPHQRKIYIEMTGEEEALVNLLTEKGETGIDELCQGSGFSMSKVSSALLNLEFEGIVKSLPGKVYDLQ